MAYEVRIDRECCVSSGKCVASEPGFFAFDDDELAVVRTDGTQPDDAAVLRVARACPSGAITLLVDGVELEP